MNLVFRIPGDGSEIELKHCASSKASVKSARKYFVHLNWIRFATNPSWLDSLFIYFKALQNMVGHPQRPKANYSGRSKMTMKSCIQSYTIPNYKINYKMYLKALRWIFQVLVCGQPIEVTKFAWRIQHVVKPVQDRLTSLLTDVLFTPRVFLWI